MPRRMNSVTIQFQPDVMSSIKKLSDANNVSLSFIVRLAVAKLLREKNTKIVLTRTGTDVR